MKLWPVTLIKSCLAITLLWYADIGRPLKGTLPPWTYRALLIVTSAALLTLDHVKRKRAFKRP